MTTLAQTETPIRVILHQQKTCQMMHRRAQSGTAAPVDLSTVDTAVEYDVDLDAHSGILIIPTCIADSSHFLRK